MMKDTGGQATGWEKRSVPTAGTTNGGQEGRKARGQEVESCQNLDNVIARATESLVAIHHGERVLRRLIRWTSGIYYSTSGLLRQKPCNDNNGRVFLPNNNGLLRFAGNDKNCAFTLAETLIILVIVGIVAALTIPSMIAKYQHQQLESQFKRSVSTISQIVLYAKNDLNENHLAQFCTEYTKEKDYYNAENCLSAIMKYANLMNKNRKQIKRNFYDIDRSNDTLLTYNGKSQFIQDISFFSIFRTNKMTDGSFLGCYINDFKLSCAIDSNGYKKPNKLGHDIFLFSVNNKNDHIEAWGNPNNNISDEDAEQYGNQKINKDFHKNIYGSPCNLTSTRSGNGIGCAYYALKNECPYDSTLKYFECLP